MKNLRNDFILVGILITVALAALVLISAYMKNGNVVIIEQGGKELYRLPISENTTRVIESDYAGTNRIEIKGEQVSMVGANCPDGLCLSHAPIRYAGESIICLPHKLVVRIEVDNG